MTDPAHQRLERAARRARGQPFFLASVLHVFQEANNFDDAALAALLRCAPADLPRLALCRRPVAEAVDFVADIDHLARRFSLDGDQLAQIIRQVDALQALRAQLAASEGANGLLRAARDRDDAEPPDEEADND